MSKFLNCYIIKLLIVLLAYSNLNRVKGQEELKSNPLAAPGDFCLAKGDSICDPSRSLVCKQGTCQCEFPWMYFDPDRRTCLVSVNEVCDHSLKLYCVQNAQCLDNGQGTGEHTCVCRSDGFTAKSVTSCDQDFDPQNPKHPWICCKNPETNFSLDDATAHDPLLIVPPAGSDSNFDQIDQIPQSDDLF